ncbi:hypothetical protein J2M53_09945 [Arthrobacter sp. zg-ZUI100]|uniref:hypothetical protein n=1 Tax=Arthrobacter jiangjiafuii TaxID=2817475 RepID=UPI001AEE85FF|nr:hypothetical protein [Arthrobacter jiangjiafuii]MBP3036571.1 hypothetical protein [Arthrobacter jiangjiafuii]
MTHPNDHGTDRRSVVLRKLRREILTAHLKVTLDEKRKRPTSPAVKFLSEMRLPALADIQASEGAISRAPVVGVGTTRRKAPGLSQDKP